MTTASWILDLLPHHLAIARLDPQAVIPAWAQAGPLISLTRTPSELSIVCEAGQVPPQVQAERGYRCLRVAGPLAFAEVGVLASLASPLAEAGISIFVFSTYDTDYLLVQEKDLEAALTGLTEAGHRVQRVE